MADNKEALPVGEAVAGWIVEHGAVSLPAGHPSRITVKNFYESPTDAANAYEEAKREFDSIFYPVFTVSIPQGAAGAASLTEEAIEWAWRYGWRACRDAETVGFDSENTEWEFAAPNVIARTLRIAALPAVVEPSPLTDHATATAAISELRAEVERLRVDAERYRYVRTYQNLPEGSACDPAFVEMWRKATAAGKLKPNGDDLDYAIDAARSAASGESAGGVV